MGLHTSVVQTYRGLLDPEVVASHCKTARDFEEAGEFQEARDSLGELWQGVGNRPNTGDLPDPIKAELLLRTGTLTGWLGSEKQVPGAQEAAKDLITESAGIFERLGNSEKLAEARIDLAICYLREGGLDESRVTLRLALDGLGDLESEQRIRALTNSAIVEQVATRLDEALRIYRESGALVDASTNHAVKGRFHNSYALALKGLGLSQDREDYIDHALVEFAAARFHFEQAGHKRFRARVENNEGFLFGSLGRFKEAHEHLDRARALLLSVGDYTGAAGADDTRAQVLLMQGKNDVAEKVARSAVRSLERGDEQSALAEALTTHGKSLARLNQGQLARTVLDRAMDVARQAGDPNSVGVAALTTIEELGKELQLDERYQYFQAAESGLSNSQHRQIRLRLGECARHLVNSRTGGNGTASETSGMMFPAISNEKPIKTDWPAGYSLEAEVLSYEANLIRHALEATGGSVTRAARLLGVTHQGLAFILNGRHKDLLAIRTPVKRRRRSIIRYH
jgi:tetratricopeptide (TPR) repeat protein